MKTKILLIYILFCTLSKNVVAVEPYLISKYLLSIMSHSTKEANVIYKKEAALLEKTPSFIKTAKILSKGKTPDEKNRIAIMLEKVIRAEYQKKGLSYLEKLNCEACIPKTLADDIDGRAIDLIKKHDDLLVKISTNQNQILAILDSHGQKIVSSQEYQSVIDKMSTIFAPSMMLARQEKTPEDFAKTFIKNIKSNSSIDVEFDAKEETFSATFKYGQNQAKIASIDLKKFISQAQYLIYGGGITALGYNKLHKENTKNSNTSDLTLITKRWELLKNLSPAEKEILITDADTDYLILRIEKLEEKITKK